MQPRCILIPSYCLSGILLALRSTACRAPPKVLTIFETKRPVLRNCYIIVYFLYFIFLAFDGTSSVSHIMNLCVSRPLVVFGRIASSFVTFSVSTYTLNMFSKARKITVHRIAQNTSMCTCRASEYYSPRSTLCRSIPIFSAPFQSPGGALI